MKRKPILLGAVFCGIVLAVIIYSTFGMAQKKVEVCMEFNGRTNCGAASGQTREFALRSATSTACAVISGGVGDTIACEQKTPVSVKWIK